MKSNLKGCEGPNWEGCVDSLLKNGSSVPSQYGKTVFLLPQAVKCTPLNNALDTIR